MKNKLKALARQQPVEQRDEPNVSVLSVLNSNFEYRLGASVARQRTPLAANEFAHLSHVAYRKPTSASQLAVLREIA